MLTRPIPIPSAPSSQPLPIGKSLNLHSRPVKAAGEMLSFAFCTYKIGSPILPGSLGGMRIE